MTKEVLIEALEVRANLESISIPERLHAIDQIYELHGIRKMPTWESLE